MHQLRERNRALVYQRLGRCSASVCLLFCGLWLAIGATTVANALETANPQVVLSDAPTRDLHRHVNYLLDADRSLDAAEAFERLPKFKPISGEYIDFSFTSDVIWLALEIHNPAADARTPLLSFNMRFMQELTVYGRKEGQLRELFHNDQESVFSERGFDYRHLLLELNIEPGSTQNLLVRYWSEGTTAMPMTLETELSMEQIRGFHRAKNLAFYACIGLMLVFSLMAGVLARQPQFLSYAFYVCTVLIYIFHMDGYSFQFLWPNWPLWNAHSALTFGMLLNVGAATFSMHFLKTRTNHPILHRVLTGIIVFAVAYALSGLVFDPAMLKRWAFPITGVISAVFLVAGLRALYGGQRDARFYVVGWTGLLACAALTTVSHWFEGLVAVGISFEAIRLGILLDATMMGLAIVDQYTQARRAQASAEYAARSALAERLELQNRFLRLDERYRTAHSMASERGLALASASHDLRQPLAALRATIGEELGDASHPDSRQNLESTVAYLETLVDRYLVAATVEQQSSEQANANNVGEHDAVIAHERFTIDVVFQNLAFMFSKDADAKGLALRIVPSSVMLDTDPLALMRILSNLISNAIRYTDSGVILVGCRRHAAHVRLIVADTGTGIPAEDIARLQMPFERGSDEGPDGGVGLGLSIVRELVESSDLNWTINSVPGRGTQVVVLVPRASLQ